MKNNNGFLKEMRKREKDAERIDNKVMLPKRVKDALSPLVNSLETMLMLDGDLELQKFKHLEFVIREKEETVSTYSRLKSAFIIFDEFYNANIIDFRKTKRSETAYIGFSFNIPASVKEMVKVIPNVSVIKNNHDLKLKHDISISHTCLIVFKKFDKVINITGFQEVLMALIDHYQFNKDKCELEAKENYEKYKLEQLDIEQRGIPIKGFRGMGKSSTALLRTINNLQITAPPPVKRQPISMNPCSEILSNFMHSSNRDNDPDVDVVTSFEASPDKLFEERLKSLVLDTEEVMKEEVVKQGF